MLNRLFAYLSPLAQRPDDEVEDVSFQLENTHLDELKVAMSHIIFYEKLEEGVGPPKLVITLLEPLIAKGHVAYMETMILHLICWPN